jgi:hypothetical protein
MQAMFEKNVSRSSLITGYRCAFELANSIVMADRINRIKEI